MGIFWSSLYGINLITFHLTANRFVHRYMYYRTLHGSETCKSKSRKIR